MSMENWNNLCKVPQGSLKTIAFGALKGKSDINPQWRIKAMTEVYGECGKAWSHRLVEQTITPGANGEVLVFLQVAVRVGDGNEFTGLGGDKIISKTKSGLVSNDEAFKMAYTDALGTALKCLGVASEIYEGNFDGSKYKESTPATAIKQPMSEEHVLTGIKSIQDAEGPEAKFDKFNQIIKYFSAKNDISIEQLGRLTAAKDGK